MALPKDWAVAREIILSYEHCNALSAVNKSSAVGLREQVWIQEGTASISSFYLCTQPVDTELRRLLIDLH